AFGGEPELRVALGPRDDWFTPEAVRRLLSEPWTVGAASDRVGMRLEGPALERAVGGELPSEGMVPGALQVPPGGRPVLFLADHPVTGGYPVVACVLRADLD
ncbi:allophanate hydrolase, partial [Streptomyces sp. NRRL F-6602]